MAPGRSLSAPTTGTSDTEPEQTPPPYGGAPLPKAHATTGAGIGVVTDEANNALVITATPKEYRRVLQVLERIDVAANQVLLEATIAEVRLNDDLKMGVRWFFDAGNHSSFSRI